MEQRANFNGTIKVSSGFKFEEEDKSKFREFLLKEFNYELAEDVNNFTIEKSFSFKDSMTSDSALSTTWSLTPQVKRVPEKSKRRSRSNAKILTLNTSTPELKAEWHKMVAFVKGLVPSVLYFPNFLFDFPNKIYLEEYESLSLEDRARYRTYKSILQDVLDGIGSGMTVDKHILERAQGVATHDKRNLESVERLMGNNITKTVFNNWNRIFARDIGNKSIDVKCNKDEIGWYLQLRIEEGASIYEIAERSLGFRWFFSFMLLTHYRGLRKDEPDNIVFLLDEPASNLHPSAQQQLLSSFGKMPNCSIVYTTHSHYMVNPSWLESAFIVKNAGLNCEAEENYNEVDTDITLERYRSFVAKHPDQTTYFQPVLDVLEYRMSELENVPDVVMLEGKNDFYSLKYMQCIIPETSSMNLMPGGSASSLDTVMRL